MDAADLLRRNQDQAADDPSPPIPLCGTSSGSTVTFARFSAAAKTNIEPPCRSSRMDWLEGRGHII